VAVEYEAKILDIDPDETARAILAAGGTHEGERFMRRYVYDIESNDATKWIRLRDNGSTTTLAVKQIAHDGIDGTSETEVTVDDFATTNELLGLIGYTAGSVWRSTPGRVFRPIWRSKPTMSPPSGRPRTDSASTTTG
jgi:adenylate cyclase class 2